MDSLITLIAFMLFLLGVFGLAVSFQITGTGDRRALRFAGLALIVSMSFLQVLGGWEKELTSGRLFWRWILFISTMVMFGLSFFVAVMGVYRWFTANPFQDERISRYRQYHHR